jgi:uncharacterized protein
MGHVEEKPVTVAVIADTHVGRIEELPAAVVNKLHEVDAVIHLGDFTSYEILNHFRGLQNFKGVFGNHDRLPVMRAGLNRIDVVELGGWRIGLFHGFFYPVGSRQRMIAWFKKYNVDILLYGHSHMPNSEMVNGIYFFNPGSASGKFPATGCSYGLLTLDGSIKSEVIPFPYRLTYRKNIFLRFSGAFIRWGIRCLEVWPWINIVSSGQKLLLDVRTSLAAVKKFISRLVGLIDL